MLGRIKRLFSRDDPFKYRNFKFHDASRKPDSMLDWTDPEDRAEGIMRRSHQAATEVARKVFQELL